MVALGKEQDPAGLFLLFGLEDLFLESELRIPVPLSPMFSCWFCFWFVLFCFRRKGAFGQGDLYVGSVGDTLCRLVTMWHPHPCPRWSPDP